MFPSVLTLPPELSLEICHLLPIIDQLSFSLVSRRARQIVLPSIFRTFTFNPGNYEITEASVHLKSFIKTLSVRLVGPDQLPRLCHFLGDLPNLSSLTFKNYYIEDMPLSDFASISHAVRNAPLRHLYALLRPYAVADKQPFPGPAGLQTCDIRWRVRDNNTNGRNAIEHLHEFIRPSLDTLHDLTVLDYDNVYKHRDLQILPGLPVLDFRSMRGACPQMHRFGYRTRSQDAEKALSIFGEMFPNLTDLIVIFDHRYGDPQAVWSDECLRPLSLFRSLTRLTLSLDFEIEENERHDRREMAWVGRYFLRRFEATKEVARVCSQLRWCMWMQDVIDTFDITRYHKFVILEEKRGLETLRVVKPVEQDWMDEWESEDLPDNMVSDTTLDSEQLRWHRFILDVKLMNR